MTAENAPIGRVKAAVVSSVRPDTRGFLDREEATTELVDLIRSGEHKIIGITALGGNGKSTFVMRVVEELANLKAFPRASLWMTMWDGAGFDEVTGRLLADLGVTDAIPNPRDRIDRVIGELAEPVVLVFDSFEYVLDDAGHCKDTAFADLLRALSTSQHRHRYVIASRRRPVDVGPGISAYCSFPRRASFAGLDNEFAIQLLRREGVVGSDEQLAVACEKLGGNPKALQLFAGELVRHYGGDAAALDKRPQLLARGAAGLVEEIARSLSEAERTLAKRVSVLRRPAPRDALVALAGEESEQTDLAIANLREQSLLEESPTGDDFTVHSLVRDASPPTRMLRHTDSPPSTTHSSNLRAVSIPRHRTTCSC